MDIGTILWAAGKFIFSFPKEVQKIFKIWTVRIPDVFLHGCWTLNTFKKRKIDKEKVLFYPSNIDTASFYGEYTIIDIYAQYPEKYWPVSNMNTARVHTYVT